MQNLIQFCGDHNIKFEEEKDLSSFSTLKLKAKGTFAEPASNEEVSVIKDYLIKNNCKYHILGL